MEVRLDERVRSEDDVKALDISAGDYISFDPMFVYTETDLSSHAISMIRLPWLC